MEDVIDTTSRSIDRKDFQGTPEEEVATQILEEAIEHKYPNEYNDEHGISTIE